jgi:hypothetical protein
MTLFRSFGGSTGHAAPSEDGIFQAKFAVKDPQARHLSSPEAGTKHVAQIERHFLKHRAPARSFVKGAPDLKSSKRSVLP